MNTIDPHSDDAAWAAIEPMRKRGVLISHNGTEWSVQIHPDRVQRGESQNELRFFSIPNLLKYAEYLAQSLEK